MKRSNTYLVFFLAVCLAFTAVPANAASAYANTYVNAADGAVDIVGVAKTQIGYNEGSLEGSVYGKTDNYQKYGVWYDEAVEDIDAANTVWDATFVAWCAAQAGIGDDVIPYVAYAPYSVAWFRQNERFYDAVSRGGAYRPKAGDLVYLASADSTIASRMGIVSGVDGDTLYTIEGNTHASSGYAVDCAVHERQYSLSYANLLGYASPSYAVLYDVNGDGQRSTADARALLSLLTDTAAPRLAFDVDGNGELNTADARALLSLIL